MTAPYKLPAICVPFSCTSWSHAHVVGYQWETSSTLTLPLGDGEPEVFDAPQ
jgi:hypothetical protein